MTCPKCGTTLTESNHPKWLESNECLKCYNERRREWKRLYKQRPEVKIKSQKWAKQYHINNYYLTWARATLHRHKVAGYVINITRPRLEEIAKQSKLCRICGCVLDWVAGKGKTKDNSPSLDRIDNGKVISEDAIQIVCYKCNTIKRNMTMKEFVEYCRNIVNRYL